MEKRISANKQLEAFAPSGAKSSVRAQESPHPIDRLHSLIGNRAVGQFIQAKLQISQPGDQYEQEADNVADQVMRMPEPAVADMTVSRDLPTVSRLQRKCTSCEEEELQRQIDDAQEEEEEIVQPKAADSPAQSALSADGWQLSSLQCGGQPLPESTRAFFEPRFGRDFSNVRIHTDVRAADSARALSARAYTVGSDIVFGRGEYQPQTRRGAHLLAHELAHTVQQAKNLPLRRTIQRATLTQFQTDLESISANHATVVQELFRHPRFVPLANFLKGCPAGTIDFVVTRIQQRVRGRLVDLFGGFSPGNPSIMTVNPFRPEHARNPIELVDTVVHEFLHAILDLQTTCTSNSNSFPLALGVLDAPRDPELVPLRTAATAAGDDPMDRSVVARESAAGVKTASGGNLLEFFDRNYGPSASRPETHYIDLNRQGLELVTSIISDIMSAHPAIGQQTVTFDNVELFQAESLLSSRSWWNASQRAYSMALHKNRVARERRIDPSTFTEREYDISAIQVVEFADNKLFDPNTAEGWGPVGGVWQCNKRSRFTGGNLHTYVTGIAANPPGGAVNYKIIQHT